MANLSVRHFAPIVKPKAGGLTSRMAVLLVDHPFFDKKERALALKTSSGQEYLQTFDAYEKTVVKLCKEAAHLKIPIFIIREENDVKSNEPYDKTVLRIAGAGAIFVAKSKKDAFNGSNIWSLLDAIKVQGVIVAGFDKYVCALETAISASMSYVVATSGELLLAGNRRYGGLHMVRASEFYQSLTHYYQKAEDLFAAMKKASGIA
ncbi:MAG: isochorismatase family protein [Candidatus Micrarchaeota archaeon]|nr:isochorismatase family protein [Candidatus Micrarchaeota archaeon]